MIAPPSAGLRQVTSQPFLESHAAVSRTALCSMAEMTRCLPRARGESMMPFKARLIDSVAPEVQNISRGLAARKRARWSRASSTAFNAAWPNRWVTDEGLPKNTVGSEETRHDGRHLRCDRGRRRVVEIDAGGACLLRQEYTRARDRLFPWLVFPRPACLFPRLRLSMRARGAGRSSHHIGRRGFGTTPYRGGDGGGGTIPVRQR